MKQRNYRLAKMIKPLIVRVANKPVLVRSMRKISSARPLPDPPDAPLLSLSWSECRSAPAHQNEKKVRVKKESSSMLCLVPRSQNTSVDTGCKATQSNNLLADTCCDLLSICSMMDLLLSPGSLCRSTTIGALVAPFSPVGYTTQRHRQNPDKNHINHHERRGELRCYARKQGSPEPGDR
jgi:hypothetical protein